MNGLVLIDKPAGCTSHDVVNRWRRLADTRRVGHLGTLDPMATGVLALLTGTATRLAQFYGGNDKTYVAEITLGTISDSYDIQGEVAATGAALPDTSEICRALERFRGRFQQVPPPVSAKKIKGTPAYKLARRQQPVELPAVDVEVKRLEVHSVMDGRIRLTVACTAGTYIRGIAHDLGQTLGCGAVLSSLRRVQSGQFTIDKAKSLEELSALAAAGQLDEAIVPAAELLPEMPSAHIDPIAEAQIRQGRDFRTSPFVVSPGAPLVKAISHSGDLIAIGQLKFPNTYHPAVVL
ncbi:MAG TPA: tRNA pseudouridine(55) synthase TruB [Bryobacteraceae bacterium]|jgi:tRNA pseudouridine55 synthase|nr:tRNA pseudouridine(55) synthase TruB [Bryobacteraceae bacterium]